jgi:hypothetical protein
MGGPTTGPVGATFKLTPRATRPAARGRAGTMAARSRARGCLTGRTSFPHILRDITGA